MLVQDHEPLEDRCRPGWSLAAAVTAATVMVVASGLKLDAAGCANRRQCRRERGPGPSRHQG